MPNEEPDTLHAAIEELMAATNACNAAAASGSLDAFTAAHEREYAAKVVYEEEFLKQGWPPIWPPLTDAGCARWGYTRAEVDEIVARAEFRQMGT